MFNDRALFFQSVFVLGESGELEAKIDPAWLDGLAAGGLPDFRALNWLHIDDLPDPPRGGLVLRFAASAAIDRPGGPCRPGSG